MTNVSIRSENAPPPVGPYSQAVMAEDTVYCAGQIGLDPATGTLVSGGIETETRQVMENLKAVLDAAGCTFADVVKTTIYLLDLAEFPNVNEVYERYFSEVPPARATVGVSALPKGASVEIDCIAVR